MILVTFVDRLGASRTVTALPGATLMQTAIRHRIPGIEAQCGGSMVCGTCHVHVMEPWLSSIPPAAAGEKLMLSCGDHQGPASRLSCQIRVTEALSGVVVHTPPSQP